MKHQAGVTLIELMICVALLAIVLNLSVSGFSSLRESQNQQITRESLASSLNSARQAAVSKRKVVYMCPTSDSGLSCSADKKDWAKGWMAYAEVDGVNGYTAGDTRIFIYANKSSSAAKLEPSGASNQVVFKPNGIVTATTFNVCSSISPSENHTIEINVLGAISKESTADAAC